MTDVQALEAMAAAEAAWIQATVQQPGCEAIAHEAWQAGWAAALEWAARQAGSLKFTLYRPAKDGPGGGVQALDVIPAGELASLLRQGGEACCGLHGRTCEPPSELCCENCTELDHPGHTQLRPCSNPDLSPNVLRRGGEGGGT